MVAAATPAASKAVGVWRRFMNAILYGNIRAEIVSGAGVRLQRFTLRRSTPYLPRPGQPGAVRKPLMLAGSAALRDG